MAVVSAVVTAVTSAATAVGAWLTSSAVGSLLVRTAISGLVSYAVSRTIGRSQSATGADPGVRLQLPPATNHKIPVLYGSAYFGGIITDAVLTNDNKYLWVMLTMSETTGPKLSDGNLPTYSLGEVYWNGNLVTFKSNGYEVDYVTDSNSNQDNAPDGLIWVAVYAGGSTSADQLTPPGTSLTPFNIYDVFPNWDANKGCNDLITAFLRLEYNSEKGVTGIGDWQFQLTNNTTLPGDCMFDYATNTRYGAGIAVADLANSDEELADIVSRLSLDTYNWVKILPDGSTYTL